jgi:hypothetical protein
MLQYASSRPEHSSGVSILTTNIGRDRRAAARLEANCDVALLAGPDLLDPSTSAGDEMQLHLLGTSLNISPNGLSLMLPAISLNHYYPTRVELSVRLFLDLPDDPVEIQATAVYARRIDVRAPEQGSVIGLRFNEISERNRNRLLEYLVNRRQN